MQILLFSKPKTDVFFQKTGHENLTDVGVRALLESDWMPNFVSCIDIDNWSLLHWAVGQGSRKIISLLVENDKFRHINEKTSNGKTAFDMAIVMQDIFILERIYTHHQFQLSPTFREKIRTEEDLNILAAGNSKLKQELVLACLRQSKPTNGSHVFMTNDSLMDLLFDYETIEMQRFAKKCWKSGCRPNFAVVDALLKRDIHEKLYVTLSNPNRSPVGVAYLPNDRKEFCWLSFAIWHKTNSTVELLLKRKDVRDAFQRPHSALFIAAGADNPEAAEMVLQTLIGEKKFRSEGGLCEFEKICNNVIEYKRNDGKDAMQMAKDANHTEIIKIIEKYRVMMKIAEKCPDFQEVQELVKEFVKLDSGSASSMRGRPDSDSDPTICEICCERKKDHALTCGHLFCKICIDEFSTRPANQRRCPTCRKTFKRDEAQKIFL